MSSELRIMEFCGGHTHALFRSGLLELLAPHIKMIHGPGCPVCVLPPHHIQAVIDLLESDPQVVACVYGDLLRIPTLVKAATSESLLAAKSRGRDVRMIYSPLDILQLASAEPSKKFVFMAIGFETTAPATALLVKELARRNVTNVSILCLHVLTPPAIETVLQALTAAERPHAIIGPGHVALVTGLKLFSELSERFGIPIVISGFEAEDLKESVELCTQSLSQKKVGVVNQYTRALKVDQQGPAQNLLEEVFDLRKTFEWRGLGSLPKSAYRLRPEWAKYDAEVQHSITYRSLAEHPQCQCGQILLGKKTPTDCRLFAKACRPSRPLGACMVSGEGACHAYFDAGVGVGKDAGAFQ